MAQTTNSPSLLVLRIVSSVVAAAAIVQTILGITLATGSTSGIHRILGMTICALTVVAALASVLWARPSGNKGMMFHALSVLVLAVAQVGLGEAGVTTIHMTVGVLFLVAAIALATLSIRKPLGSAA